MGTDSRALTSSAPLVALAAWFLPGAGYALIGQRTRGLVSGISIILLFIAGLLIAGVRVVEVPGYEVLTGQPRMLTIMAPAFDAVTHKAYVDRNQNQIVEPVWVPVLDPKTNQPVIDPVTGNPKKEQLKRWVLLESPLSEIRDKPWSVPQILTGPIAIAAGAWSVHAAAVDPTTGISVGAITHARINELGSLYLSVAGLLNLMVIIDSTWRASHISEKRSEAEATA